MRLKRTYYEIMGVEKNASAQDIKQKYYALARQYHPDRASDKEMAQRLFAQINIAYQTLSNTTKRSKYDADLDYEAGLARKQAEAGYSIRPAMAVGAQPVRSVAFDMNALVNQAQTEFFKGDKETALKICQRVLSVAPANFEMLRLSGDIYAETNMLSEAMTAYQRAIKVQPTNRMVQEKIRQIKARRKSVKPVPARPQQSAKIAPQAKPSFFKRLIGGAR